MILRTILAGVAGRGQWAVDAIAKDDRFRPVALVDANPTAAKLVQYQLGQAGRPNVPTFSGMTGALSQIEADVAVICTPTRSHGEHVRMAFAAGLHVLVEPGMTNDFKDARQMVEEADSAWLRFAVAHRHRYAACESTLRYILEKADHPHSPGKVHTVDYVRRRHVPDPGAYDYPFAMLWDVAVNDLDALIPLLGRPNRVSARSFAAPWTAFVHEANLWATIEFENGALCNYVLSHDAAVPEWRASFEGERGALVMTDQATLRFHPRPTHQPGATFEAVDCDVTDCPTPATCVADDFFRYVAEEVEPPISARRALRAVAACEMLMRSASNKRPVDRAELG